MPAPVTFVRATLTDSDTLNAAAFNALTAPSATVSDATPGTAGVMPATTTLAGLALINALDAAAQRIALGLGSLATQSGTFSGSSSGTNTGDQTTISGNAGTATALATPRLIGGSSFNGTANITSFPAPGPIGGTTPSTAVFTTLHQGTAGAQGLAVGFSGAAGQGFTLRDTTNSRTYFITTETATGLQINSGANPITLVGNTNVTGALSATGSITTTAGSFFGVAGTYNLSAGSEGLVFGSATAAILRAPAGTSSLRVGNTDIVSASASAATVTGNLNLTGVLATKASGSLSTGYAYWSLQSDGGATERGWIGYGSANGTMGIVNTVSSVFINAQGTVSTFSSAGVRLNTSSPIIHGSEGFSLLGPTGVVAAGIATDSTAPNVASFWHKGTGTKTLINFYSNDGGSFGLRGSISTDGTNTSYNTSSDARLKTNVRPITGSGEIIDALKPSLFDWKTGQKDSYGFIAQEAYAVFPQAVTKGDEDPDTITQQWAMDAGKFMPVAIAEIQSLRARVAHLEAA
jgi:hypothetical protein